MKPYLYRSFGLHALVFVGFIFYVPHVGKSKDKVYMIDFVGGPATIMSASSPTSQTQAPPKSAAAEIDEQVDPDSVVTSGRKAGKIVLPRPSLLKGASEEAPLKPSASTSLAGQSQAKSASSLAGGVHGSGGGAGVSTDLPNFPYPWYISQVRQMLWQSWQRRMPALELEGMVSFSILRNGSITDLSIESSAGDASFDQAALASVKAAAPFPALPNDFRETFLKIHLTVKSEITWR